MEMTPVKNITKESEYSDKLLKLIPGEVVAAYITIDGIIPANAATAKWVSLVVSIVLFCAIPLYLARTLEVENTTQIVFTMASFVVWLYSLGGPFKFWATATGVPFHVPWIGSIVLILWTALIPLAVGPMPPHSEGHTNDPPAPPAPGVV